MALAGLVISELSADCECRLFGTGLVMSENASDCIQNAAFRDRKLKKFLGRGHSHLPNPLPIGEGNTPSKTPPPRRLRRFDPRRLDSRAFGAPSVHPLSLFAPPPSHTSGYGPGPSTKFEVRRPSRSEDTAHLVCQLSIYNSFPVIRTTIAK